MFSLKEWFSKQEESKDSILNDVSWVEKFALFSSLFFLSFGIGFVNNGKKLFHEQLKVSQRVEFKSEARSYQ